MIHCFLQTAPNLENDPQTLHDHTTFPALLTADQESIAVVMLHMPLLSSSAPGRRNYGASTRDEVERFFAWCHSQTYTHQIPSRKSLNSSVFTNQMLKCCFCWSLLFSSDIGTRPSDKMCVSVWGLASAEKAGNGGK